MKDIILQVYSKSFSLKGRSSRSEFWKFQLFYLLFIISTFWIFGAIVPLLFIVASIPAKFSLTVRRLHDADWNGWTMLWCLFSLNVIPLIVCCFSGTPEKNRFDTK
jgi:uncharacterized membrane protein YhaH (DUF805 family)